MKCCGTCHFWKRIKKQEKGACRYSVIFPDSLFGRAEGFRKTMPEGQGDTCPAHKYKEEDEDKQRNSYSHKLMINED